MVRSTPSNDTAVGTCPAPRGLAPADLAAGWDESLCAFHLLAGRVQAMTPAAAQRLQRHGCLALDGDRLQIAEPRADAWLTRVLTAPWQAAQRAGPPPQIVVSDRFEDLVLTVLWGQPAGQSAAGATPATVIVHAHPRAHGGIPRFTLDDDAPPAGWTAWKLTPAETRVALLLMHGKSCPQIAAQLRISTDGVRFHIKNLLAKTGCRRQTQMIAEFARAAWQPLSPPPG